LICLSEKVSKSPDLVFLNSPALLYSLGVLVNFSERKTQKAIRFNAPIAR